jgi:hypothetical protein
MLLSLKTYFPSLHIETWNNEKEDIDQAYIEGLSSLLGLSPFCFGYINVQTHSGSTDPYGVEATAYFHSPIDYLQLCEKV